MRINLGFKAWSTLSAMLLSLVVISGCNDEGTTPSTTPATNPGPAPAVRPVEPVKKPDTATPPPPTTKADDKAAEKK